MIVVDAMLYLAGILRLGETDKVRLLAAQMDAMPPLLNFLCL